MKRKLAAFLAAIVMLTAIAIPASAREVVYYYFTLSKPTRPIKLVALTGLTGIW